MACWSVQSRISASAAAMERRSADPPIPWPDPGALTTLGAPAIPSDGSAPLLPRLPSLQPAREWSAGVVSPASAGHPCRSGRRALVPSLDGPPAAAPADRGWRPGKHPSGQSPADAQQCRPGPLRWRSATLKKCWKSAATLQPLCQLLPGSDMVRHEMAGYGSVSKGGVIDVQQLRGVASAGISLLGV